jgi:prepilin-type processing-associated H-X9-DG protein
VSILVLTLEVTKRADGRRQNEARPAPVARSEREVEAPSDAPATSVPSAIGRSSPAARGQPKQRQRRYGAFYVTAVIVALINHTNLNRLDGPEGYSIIITAFSIVYCLLMPRISLLFATIVWIILAVGTALALPAMQVSGSMDLKFAVGIGGMAVYSLTAPMLFGLIVHGVSLVFRRREPLERSTAESTVDEPIPAQTETRDDRPKKKGPMVGYGAAFVILALSIVAGYKIVTLIGASTAAGRQCRENVTIASEGLLAYERQLGKFPAARKPYRENDPPMSWRVRVLPYADHEMLFRSYDRRKTWDSREGNVSLYGPNTNYELSRMPMQCYHCPIDLGERHESSYLMVVGPGTISDGEGETRIDEISDGRSNTILYAEVDESGIAWSEPRDLDGRNDSTYRVSGGPHAKGVASANGIRSRHRGGAHVAFADGSVRFLSNDTDPQVVRALTTIASGEDVGEFPKQR